MKIGDILEVEILQQDNFGKGIARYNNFVIFVDKGIVNETLKIKIYNIKKNYAKASIVDIINRIDKRIEYPCTYYDRCGGCNIGHLDYNAQLEYKLNRLKETLNISNIEIFPMKQYNYRNKVTLRVNKSGLGLYESMTNKIVNIDNCLICNENINKVIFRLNNIKLNDIEEVTIKSLDKTMLNIIGNINKYYIIDHFKDIDSIYLNNNLIYGNDYIDANVLDLTFRVSNNSFFQVNIEGMIMLYKTIFKSLDLTKSDVILDLYSGVGTISLYLSKHVKKVIGIEVVKEAVELSNVNKHINNINNVEFICDKAENAINNIEKIDIVIVDPPRNGLKTNVINKILELNPRKIVYVSCNPDTLKRDIEMLYNYRIVKSYIIDMFPNTYHIESLIVLEKLY